MFPLLIGSSTAWASDSDSVATWDSAWLWASDFASDSDEEARERKARRKKARERKARKARAARAKKICGYLTSLLGIGGLVTFTYLYQIRDQFEVYALENEGSDAKPSEEEGDSTRADALENEGSDARSSEEEKNSIPTSEKVIKHSPDVGQDKKVVPSISSSIGIYPLLFTLIVLGGLYLFLYRDFYFSALPQPAAADDADSAEGDVLSGEEGDVLSGEEGDVLSGEEGEATPSGTEAGKYPILLGVLVLIGSVALYIYTNYSGEEDDQVEESA